MEFAAVLCPFCPDFGTAAEAPCRPRCRRCVGSRKAAWHPGVVTDALSEDLRGLEPLVPEWLTVPDAAELLGVDVVRVRSMLKDRQLLAVRRGERPVLSIPSAFVQDGRVLKGLPGLLTLLMDA